MVYQKSITFSDWVHATFLSGYDGNNFSKFIEGLVVKGAISNMEGDEEKMQAITKMQYEIDKLKNENHQLKLRLTRAKSDKKPKKVILYEDGN